jgi:hypothetical protein
MHEKRIHLGVVKHANGDYQLVQSSSKESLRALIASIINADGGLYVCEQSCAVTNTERVIEMIGSLFLVEFDLGGYAQKVSLQ